MMCFELVFVILLVINSAHTHTYGIKELTSEQFVDTFKQNQINDIFYFIAFTSFPCKACDQLIYAMNMASILLSEDLDVKPMFINLNVSNDPKILHHFNFNISMYPKAYMMYSKSNYSLIEYENTFSPNIIAKTIKSFLPSRMVELQTFNNLKARIDKSYDFIILGIFTDINSTLFSEYNQTSSQEFRFAKTYYTINFMDFKKVFQKSGYENDIFIIRNPYLYGEQDFISFRVSGSQNLSNFLKFQIAGEVELCTPSIFRVYALQKTPIYVFVFAPKYKKEGLNELIQNLKNLNYDYKTIKICVSVSGFDNDLLRMTNTFSIGESFILSPNQKIYKGDKYQIYENYTVSLDNLRKFFDDFLGNKAEEYIYKQEVKELKIERNVEYIDTRNKFSKFSSNNSLNLLAYLYEGKANQLIIDNINILVNQLKNYSKIVKVGIIDTEVALIENQYLRYGKHNIFIYRRANTSNFMAYRGERNSKGLLEFIKLDINDQIISKSQSTQENNLSPISEDL